MFAHMPDGQLVGRADVGNNNLSVTLQRYESYTQNPVFTLAPSKSPSRIFYVSVTFLFLLSLPYSYISSR